MQPAEAFKPLGLISLSITWLALGFMVFKWRGHRSMSFSRHAAANKTAFFMMAVIETFLFPTFFLFIYKWYVPTFKLSIIFDILVGLSSLGLMVAAWVPDIPGIKRKIHELTAYGSALLFIPISAMMCFVPDLPILVHSMWILALVYTTVCTIFFLTNNKAHDYHLYLQAPYFGLPHAAILMTVYIR